MTVTYNGTAHVQRQIQLEQQRDALLAAARRALSWLSSYPGGGAIPAYDELKAAIANAEAK